MFTVLVLTGANGTPLHVFLDPDRAGPWLVEHGWVMVPTDGNVAEYHDASGQFVGNIKRFDLE